MKGKPISKEQQLEIFNRYWDRIKLEMTDTIELGGEWIVEEACLSKKSPKINRVFKIEYQCQPHLFKI